MIIFSDWLDVTYHPDDSPALAVETWLLAEKYFLDSSSSTNSGRKEYWYTCTGVGSLVIQYCKKFVRISLSGSILNDLRASKKLEEFCFMLGAHPHKITRLDAYTDLPVDGADFLAEWRAAHPEPDFALYRNRLPVTYFTAIRGDGRESGTIYFGHRTRARIIARVYDKALQAFQVSKGLIRLPPTTRVEVTRREGATLRDVCSPEAMFWDIAQSILPRPENIPEWEPVDMTPEYPKPAIKLPYEVLKHGVESDPHLDALLRVADTFPSGREVLLKLVERRILSGSASEAA